MKCTNSSTRRVRRKIRSNGTCPASGKTCYPDWATANAVLEKQVFREAIDDSRPTGMTLTVFHCQHCNMFHIGNTIKFERFTEQRDGNEVRKYLTMTEIE